MTKSKQRFYSYDNSKLRILDVTPCKQKYLFHSSWQKFDNLDPKYCRKENGKYEHGVPVVFADNKPSNMFAGDSMGDYEKRVQNKEWAHYNLIFGKRIISLGKVVDGYIYVVQGESFYEVLREDFMGGMWVKSKEWVSSEIVVPIEVVKINKAIDVEMIEEYEFIGEEYVGNIPIELYLVKATNETVIEAIKNKMNEPFIPKIPIKLKKYYQSKSIL